MNQNVENELRDADLPRWLAHSYAALQNARVPVERYKRAIELWELLLSWLILALAARAGDQEAARTAVETKGRRDDGSAKLFSIGDRVALVRDLCRLENANESFLPRQRSEPTSAFARAVSVLSGEPPKRVSLDELLQLIAKARNAFSHGVAADDICDRQSAMLRHAFEELFATARVLRETDVVFVEAAERRRAHAGGAETIARTYVLRGSAALTCESCIGPPDLYGDALYLRDRATGVFLAPVPEWVARWTNGHLEIFDGFSKQGGHYVAASVPTSTAPEFELRDAVPRGAAETYIEVPCDSPPRNYQWVGRSHELNRLIAGNEPVVFVTGMGGHGKSSLAAKLVEEAGGGQSFDVWDWRDCREQNGRLRGHLAAVVERATRGRVPARALADAEPEELARQLFQHLRNHRWLIVFDNVDQYIDLESNRPTPELAPLVHEAATRDHRCKIVFTCRRAVELDHPACLHLPLTWMNEEEAQALFRAFGVRFATDAVFEEVVREAHTVTSGHPLWLSLVARKFLVRETEGRATLRDIRANRTTHLPQPVLESIWKQLRPEEHELLRAMAEILRPQTRERLAELTAEYIKNRNRFEKRFKNVCAVGLVVERESATQVAGAQGSSRDTLFDLHPLIRQFVWQRYPVSERSAFISAIKRVCDYVARRFVSSESYETPEDARALDNDFDRIDMAASLGEFTEALCTLTSAHRAAHRLGRVEEFVRTGLDVVDRFEFDWSALAEDNIDAHNALYELIVALAHLGRVGDAYRLLDRYEQSLRGRSVPYVNLCRARAYVAWFQGDYQESIKWGERGRQAKGDADIRFDTANELALARRDGGEPGLAIEMFLDGNALEDLIRGTLVGSQHAERFGNVGRCLYFMGRIEDALACYFSSLRQLLHDADADAEMNQGYACLWIAEAFRDQAQLEAAYIYARRARTLWEHSNVARVRLPAAMIEKLKPRVPAVVISMPESEIAARVRSDCAQPRASRPASS